MSLVKANKKRRRQLLANAIEKFVGFDAEASDKCTIGVGLALMGKPIKNVWLGDADQWKDNFGKFYGIESSIVHNIYWDINASRAKSAKRIRNL